MNSTTIGGYAGGRKTRVTDRFVRYPYPKTMGTGYTRDFKDRLAKAVVMKNGEGFNLEKEAKIINPHKMDLKTTAKDNFKPFTPEVKEKKLRKYVDEGKPILGASAY